MIDKIKKLMALSESDNPNESAVALAKAKVLMEKYNITEFDLATATIKESRSPACNTKSMPLYVLYLAHLIADLFNCGYMRRRQSHCGMFGGKTWLQDVVFVGYEPHHYIAKYVFDVLLRKLKKQRTEYIANSLRRKRRTKTLAGDSYAAGWVSALGTKIERLVPERRNEVNQDYNPGLVPMNAIEAYIDAQSNGNGGVKSPPKPDVKDFVNGLIDGSKVNIHKPVSTAEATKHLN